MTGARRVLDAAADQALTASDRAMGAAVSVVGAVGVALTFACWRAIGRLWRG